ncbi:hypothetical protein L3X38_004865 [Prunus dulcis]|uniref:Uncharacterized protein n=1 Tax=Prunus dulcis TaxID=3755 RepID=A0AAD4ZPU4_PRUDU|nr:hypothetical protein L3X38_004865 [Prunus dulcis]
MRKSGLTRGSPNLVILCLRKGVSLRKIKFLQKGTFGAGREHDTCPRSKVSGSVGFDRGYAEGPVMSSCRFRPRVRWSLVVNIRLPSVYVAFGYDNVHRHPVCLQFVSALDICLTSFGDAQTVRARNADQADYGPLNPASLRLGLTLCHRDLPGELTDYQELTELKRGDSVEFSVEVEALSLYLEWQIGHLCPIFAKCRTRIGSGSNSKAEFGSGPVCH